MADTTLFPIAMAGVGAIIWAVRLEGRFNRHEATDAIVHKNVDEKLSDLKQDMKDLKKHFGVKSSGESPQV